MATDITIYYVIYRWKSSLHLLLSNKTIVFTARLLYLPLTNEDIGMSRLKNEDVNSSFNLQRYFLYFCVFVVLLNIIHATYAWTYWLEWINLTWCNDILPLCLSLRYCLTIIVITIMSHWRTIRIVIN